MKFDYEVMATNGSDEIVLDVGVSSNSSANALQSVIRKHGVELSQFNNLTITVMLQRDSPDWWKDVDLIERDDGNMDIYKRESAIW